MLRSFRKWKEKVFYIKVLPAFERIQHGEAPTSHHGSLSVARILHELAIQWNGITEIYNRVIQLGQTFTKS